MEDSLRLMKVMAPYQNRIDNLAEASRQTLRAETKLHGIVYVTVEVCQHRSDSKVTEKHILTSEREF